MTADFFAKVFAAATLLAVIPTLSAAQDLHCESGDIEVRGLEFVGNKTFSAADLGNVIVTTPSAWARRTLRLPFAAKRCLDRAEFGNDRLRLVLFYRHRGFPDVTVDTALRPSGPIGVVARFKIAEGVPLTLQSMIIAGLDSVERRGTLLRNLPIRIGQRFDLTKIDAVKDTIARRLRNRGYPNVAVNNTYATRPSPSGPLVDDSISVQTGPFTRFGGMRISVTPARNRRQQISNATVRRLIHIDSGSVYREHAITDAQRALYLTDAYVDAPIRLDSALGRRVGSDSIAPLDVSLAENTMHAARVGFGYGTLDCFRISGELDDDNFLGDARQLQLQARVSKIGIGHPLGGAPALCPQAEQDQYSDSLNYYLGATLQQPFLFGLHTVPTITAYKSRVSEYNAYLRTTLIGGVASTAWQLTPRTPLTFSYSLDYGSTTAQPALFCAVFSLCDSTDINSVQQNRRLAVLSTVLAHNGADNTVAPTRGGTERFEVRYASPHIFSDTALQFNTLLGDVARYISVGGGNVLALRLRAGAVFGAGFRSNTGFIPPQERMYAGGPTTVRGFVQNELGAVSYITSSYDTTKINGLKYFRPRDSTYLRAVPLGGNALVVGNVELRLRSPFLPDLVQFALFTDAGDVWNHGDNDDKSTSNIQIKVTPGIQAAVLTPIGPVRVVLGYNPYQLPSGPAYYENSAAAGGALLCVSPTNTLPVVSGGSPTNPVLVQQSGVCSSSFAPAQHSTFLSRLTFGLAIGQAF